MDKSTLIVAERQLTGLGRSDPLTIWYDNPLAYHFTDERTPETRVAFFFSGLFQFFNLKGVK